MHCCSCCVFCAVSHRPLTRCSSRRCLTCSNKPTGLYLPLVQNPALIAASSLLSFDSLLQPITLLTRAVVNYARSIRASLPRRLITRSVSSARCSCNSGFRKSRLLGASLLARSRTTQHSPQMVVGWYHSHPGFGCWLSGVDVNTQQVGSRRCVLCVWHQLT